MKPGPFACVVFGGAFALLGGVHCGSSDAGVDAPQPLPCEPDESAPVVPRCAVDPTDTSLPPCETWVKVEIPGTFCGDGSPYKFFVNHSTKSNNLAISLEPGGACWDYASCTGTGGIRGAANPHGIPDTHMDRYQFLNFLRRTPENPAADYNLVFIPYCTGDTHSGDNEMTYTSETPGPDGSPPASIVYRHRGHKNVLAVVDWLKQTFTTVPKLFVTGCSAGGAGALLNYHFIRQGLGAQAQCGYLLDDSGPIFHSDGPSLELHKKIRSAWNVDAVLESLDGELPVKVNDLKADFGLMNVALARKYPRDRLSLVAYRMDLNYSLYSYQRFFPASSEADIHAQWWQDMQGLMATYKAEPNLAYYLPFFRSDNCSHCVSIPPLGNPPSEPTNLDIALGQPWLGSEIEAAGVTLEGFSRDLLDDRTPLRSYVEAEQEQTFTPAVSMACMKGG